MWREEENGVKWKYASKEQVSQNCTKLHPITGFLYMSA